MRILSKRQLRGLLRLPGELRRRRQTRRRIAVAARKPGPPRLEPVWPLPRAPAGPSDAEIERRFRAHLGWQYAYEFEGRLAFAERHTVQPFGHRDGDASRRAAQGARPLQRFRHFMPWLVQAAGGTLCGRRVLDIACNSGFWSLQCALLGAREVIGFDARPELIEQAKLLRTIVGLRNVDFRVLDFWDMSEAALGGRFDVVLNLGVLYHLPDPLQALERTRRMAAGLILLDTAVHASDAPLIRLDWETSEDVWSAPAGGLVQLPSKRSVELMLRHVGLGNFSEIPLRSADMPPDYLTGRRASWLIRIDNIPCAPSPDPSCSGYSAGWLRPGVP